MERAAQGRGQRAPRPTAVEHSFPRALPGSPARTAGEPGRGWLRASPWGEPSLPASAWRVSAAGWLVRGQRHQQRGKTGWQTRHSQPGTLTWLGNNVSQNVTFPFFQSRSTSHKSPVHWPSGVVELDTSFQKMDRHTASQNVLSEPPLLLQVSLC